MRDFEQDVIRSANFDGSVKLSYFSWSLAAQMLFGKCPRAYFIRYMIAQGGWDQFCHPAAASAYREKHLQKLDFFLGDLFHESVNEALIAVSTADIRIRKQLFDKILLKSISKRLSAMSFALKNPTDDPKSLHLLELRGAKRLFSSPDEVVYYAAQTLKNAYTSLIVSELPGELFTLPGSVWNVQNKYVSFQVDGVPVYIHPGLIFQSQGKLHCIDFVCSENEPNEQDFSPRKAAIFSLFAENYRSCSDIFYREFCFNDKTAVLREIAPVSKSEIRDWLRSGIHEIQSKLRPDGKYYIADFFCLENQPDVCEKCQFQDTCRLLNRATNAASESSV